MFSIDVYRAVKARVEVPRPITTRSASAQEGFPLVDVSYTDPPKLNPVEKAGVWVWICLLGPAVLYELVAFADGSEGQATLSQVVKGFRRSGGIAASIGLALALIGACIALILHWVIETF